MASLDKTKDILADLIGFPSVSSDSNIDVIHYMAQRLRDVGADVQLQVTGWMPAHSHGLVQMPSVEVVGDGRYLVRGMLLHMRGDWQVRFSIIANRSLETATFELTL